MNATVFVSDIHGNALALRRCLEEAAALNPASVHCLGDVVGYYPDALECLDLLDRAGATLISGNHEAMLTGRLPLDPGLDEVYRLARLRSTLPPEVLDRLGRLPDRRHVDVGGTHVLLTHGSPAEPLTGRVRPGDDLEPHLDGIDSGVVLVANTHRPFVRRHLHLDVTVVNVGSIGLPRDLGTMASFVVHDPAKGFEVVRVELDPAEVRAAYPDVHPSVVAMLDRKEPS